MENLANGSFWWAIHLIIILHISMVVTFVVVTSNNIVVYRNMVTSNNIVLHLRSSETGSHDQNELDSPEGGDQVWGGGRAVSGELARGDQFCSCQATNESRVCGRRATTREQSTATSPHLIQRDTPALLQPGSAAKCRVELIPWMPSSMAESNQEEVEGEKRSTAPPPPYLWVQ